MLTTQQQKSLEKLFHKRTYSYDAAAMITYEVDAGFDRATPDAVFYPDSAGQVSKIINWAKKNDLPIVARGAGTGLAGGAVAERGGIVVEFARMNKISDVDTVGRSVTVGAGTVNLALDAAVKEHGLYYPPDPSSQRSSTLGGNISTNAGGPHCFKYGVTTNYVTGLEIIIADGSVMQLGGQAYDYPEYDFCALLCGGEGTLGIVSRADLRLIRNPTGVKTLMVAFNSEADAGSAVSAVIAAGVTPATLELMDQNGMQMIEQFVSADLPVDASAVLIAEVDGYPEGLDTQLEEVADLFTENGGFDLRIAQTEEDRARIWYGRKSAAGALSRLAPSYYLTDVTVPRSHLGEVLTKINDICNHYQVTTANFFHAGDGNLHPLILCDASDAELMARVHKAGKEIIELCVAYDGSITGEHGIGMEKRGYMTTMFSPEELSALRDIKQIFDPDNLLNPGKILPDSHAEPTYQSPTLPETQIFAPQNAQDAAAAFRAIGQSGKRAWIGSATTPGHSQLESGANYWLSTSQLGGIHKLAADDLYITVGAGTPVSELVKHLDEQQLQCALVSPWADATVGTLLASNINAPWRMRYGSLRDNLLCCHVALPDGRAMRAGRPVVKNVAGYDLPKLFVGSYGTLGLMTEATLKLTPKPRHKRSIAVPVSDPQTALQWAGKIAPLLLITSSVLLCETPQLAPAAPSKISTPYVLIYTAEGMHEDIEAELTQIEAMLQGLGAPPSVPMARSGNELWQGFVGSSNSNEMSVRVGMPPRHLAATLQALPTEAFNAANWLLDIASGLAYAKVDLAGAVSAKLDVISWLTTVRQAAHAREGYAIVLTQQNIMSNEKAMQIDRWGYRPDSLGIMNKLKARWDPHGLLNPGAFRLIEDNDQ